ncbi:MAG: tetratricopeptide repeat protein [Candidatus Accumulibacter sp.]|uniref:tetratricopeptide repeat protein n=1 Tax=Accumulibacter sp. TaxID=2053492 RepID=UPI0028798BEA|nr:tetratricopeptide repeat protein [Accumulibacter sp.]MDS4013414.1 tetratricopeptide repeat protein [Accumulibacter sp.]
MSFMEDAAVSKIEQLCANGDFKQMEMEAAALTHAFPTFAKGWLLLGQALLSQGKPAIGALERAQTLFPDDTEALGLLAIAYQRAGEHESAYHLFSSLLSLRPRDPVLHYNMGLLLLEMARPVDAEAAFACASMLVPSWVEARFNRAVAAEEMGEFGAATRHYEEVLRLRPDYASAHFNLGHMHRKQGAMADAELAFRAALQVNPAYEQAAIALSQGLEARGAIEDAASTLRRFLLASPGNLAAELGLAAIHLRKKEFHDALTRLRRAVMIDPASKTAWESLAACELALNNREEACNAYARAVALCGPLPKLVIPYANLLYSDRQFDKATELLRKVPQDAEDYCNVEEMLIRVMASSGDLPGANRTLRAAMISRPGAATLQVLASWIAQLLGDLSAALISAKRAVALDPENTEARSMLLFLYNYQASEALSYRVEEARKYGALVASRVRKPYVTWHCENAPARLRVGLVSGDFREHAVGHFLDGVLQAFATDARGLELFAYPTFEEGGVLAARLRGNLSRWHSLVGMTDEEAAAKIHQDGIHVLIDLSGHTMHNRLPVFAWKPAPLQASWLAYFATTGVSEIDYVLVDRVGVPCSDSAEFTEKICYLPDTRLCFSVPEGASAVSDLPALRRGYLTFGCIQNLQKITEELLGLWADIMRAVPHSRLRIQAPQLVSEEGVSSLRMRLSTLGIALDRVELTLPDARGGYLAGLSEVDFLLDTFPFPGGTTTCEALWMGVPTLTLAGATLLARQGASILTAAGLPDWVVRDGKEYVDKAVEFSQSTDRLQKLRSTLREQVRHSPLFDAERFATGFAQTLWALWRTSAGGKA